MEGVKEPPSSLIIEPDKQKPFHYRALTLIGVLRPLPLYSAKLPRLRLGEGQVTPLPFVNTLPYLRYPVSGSHLPLPQDQKLCYVQSQESNSLAHVALWLAVGPLWSEFWSDLGGQ